MLSLEKLNISPLQKAIQSLERAIQKHVILPTDEFIRDACIQRFEYTYELCVKFLRRYLEISETNRTEIKEMSFPAIIRTADSRGLLKSDWTGWKSYRELRNITSHTYNEEKATAVVAGIPAFLQDAQYLLEQLQSRIKSL
jgi:nucleotidyltransferase substrate binding protein (TIGR01987 family)